jgi:hypothetical protein
VRFGHDAAREFSRLSVHFLFGRFFVHGGTLPWMIEGREP